MTFKKLEKIFKSYGWSYNEEKSQFQNYPNEEYITRIAPINVLKGLNKSEILEFLKE